jgi:hypothetical protein
MPVKILARRDAHPLLSSAMRVGAAALLALGLSLTTSARADGPVPSLDLRDFHPPTDPQGSLYTEPATTPGPGNWNFGAYASYALSPVVLENAQGDVIARVVQHQLSLDYFANVGLGKRFAVGLMVPTVLYQSGTSSTELLPDSSSVPHVAVGDATLGVKATLVAPADLGGFGLAALGRFYVPVDAPHSYVSDRSVRGEGRLLGELDLLAVALRVTAGVRLRADPETFLRNGTDDYRFGNDLPWGAALTFKPQVLGIDPGGHLRFAAEAHGSIGLSPGFAHAPESPALFGLSARYTVKDVSALFGVELPLDRAIGVPLVRPVIGIGWAPRVEDEDGDGIEDDKDQCPELAEDKNGFEDSDGCPDADNDSDDDGVPDLKDRCPQVAEDKDGFQDEDGCPDPDNDGDGVPDVKDPCPNVKGDPKSPIPGCPDPDPDHDGIPVGKDKCPDQPEDRDGFQDDDGCPDPDNDGDGVLDTMDACPLVKGEASPAAELNGCLIADHDGDTFDDAKDACPNEPEDFNGTKDEDGCPDGAKAAALVTVQAPDAADIRFADFRVAPRFVRDEVDPQTLSSLRALAVELNHHPEWIAAAGVRPAGRGRAAEQQAQNRAFSIALTLRWLTHRDGAAEVVGWGAVSDAPKANIFGLGVLLLTPHVAGPSTGRPP